MKSLNNCKIAVCFVGQSRTFKYCAESIKSFFSSTKNNSYHFFCHTWNTNSYKVREGDTIHYKLEKVDDIEHLREELENTFNFEKLVVDEEIHRNYPWASVLYSTMRSNLLKQQYEVENNMMFDLVVKARLDVCYKPGTTLESCLEASNNYSINEKALYANFGFMNYEFYLPNPDDVIYCGTSLTMDLIDSLYNSISTESFKKILNASIENNPAYFNVGPGVLLYKWMTIKNIMPINNIINHAVYRKESIGVDPLTNWQKMVEIADMVY